MFCTHTLHIGDVNIIILSALINIAYTQMSACGARVIKATVLLLVRNLLMSIHPIVWLFSNKKWLGEPMYTEGGFPARETVDAIPYTPIPLALVIKRSILKEIWWQLNHSNLVVFSNKKWLLGPMYAGIVSPFKVDSGVQSV